MTEIEKLAKRICDLDVNDPMQLIQIVALQGAIAGLFKAREAAHDYEPECPCRECVESKEMISRSKYR